MSIERKPKAQNVSAKELATKLRTMIESWEEPCEVPIPTDWEAYFLNFCRETKYTRDGRDHFPYYRERGITPSHLPNLKGKLEDDFKDENREDLLSFFKSIEFYVCMEVQKIVSHEYIKLLHKWVGEKKQGEKWCLGELWYDDRLLFYSFNNIYVKMSDKLKEYELSHEILMEFLLPEDVLENNPYKEVERGAHFKDKRKAIRA